MASGEDKGGGRTIAGISCCDHFRSWAEAVLDFSFGSFGLVMDEEKQTKGALGREERKKKKKREEKGKGKMKEKGGKRILTNFQIPKMVPMVTPQSMLEDPSRGSKQTMYLPLKGSSTKMASSFSSETRIAVFPDDFRELMKISLAMTSNFFWSSPCTFSLPARPIFIQILLV